MATRRSVAKHQDIRPNRWSQIDKEVERLLEEVAR